MPMLTLQELEKAREERGLQIAKAKEAQVSRIDDATHKVLSQSGNGAYLVSLTKDGWVCECPDHKYRAVKCKHIYAVEISIKLKEQVKKNVVINEVLVSKCLFCHSENIKKVGLRHNKYGDIQKYRCKSCGHWFTINLGFEGMHATPRIITSAMQLYFTGESFRNVRNFLRLQGVNFSHQAVYNWVKKYTAIMESYLDQIKPQVSDTWRADELYVKIKGDMKYLFALMDNETRFWIAQEVADTKYQHDARGLFRMGKELTGKKPLTIITDGLSSYHIAYKKEFWTTHSPRTVHIKNITWRGERNNNKMERMNGEVRDREKVMRGLKKKNTPIISGYKIFHNYVRPHEALEGKTPAEACGIEVKGQNKWMTLIQNAKKASTENQ